MSTVTFTTDHDPYPAKAGNNFVNDGFEARTFSDLRSISDVSKQYVFTYRGGETVVDNPQDVTFPKSYSAGSIISGITIGSSGAFTCTATTLKVGDRVAISGLLGNTASIVGYVGTQSTGNVYLVSAVTGTSSDVTGFTLKTTENVAISTALQTAKQFDGGSNSVVDRQFDRITITGHGFRDLTEVTYTAGSTALSPLINGNKYFVKVLDVNTIALYSTLVLATSGLIEGRQNFTTATINAATDGASNHTLTSTLSELTYTSQISSPETLSTLLGHAVGITSNGVLIFSAATRDIPLMGSAPSINAPLGFNWDVVKRANSFNLDNASGKPIDNSDTVTDIYCYRSGNFLNGAWDSTFTASGSYYGTTGLTHPDGHSKIVGMAFDGYPIYGPKGYNTANDRSSGTTNMTSSYVARAEPAAGRVYTYAQQESGSFIQDYVFSDSSGTLDEHNGRFCVTPDFPNGTYAYFVTATYPYIIGPSTKAQRSVTIT